MHTPRSGPLVRIVAVALATVALIGGSLGAPAVAETVPSGEPAIGAVTGRITDPNANPVEDATVAVFAWRASDNSWADSETTHVRTVADGTFAVTSLEPGRYTVRAESGSGGGYLSTWLGDVPFREQAESFEVDADHRLVERSIQLRAAGSISGVVTSSGGIALAGARVTIRSHSGSFGGERTTGTNGRFSFGGLYPGDYTAYVKPPFGTGLVGNWWNATGFEDEATAIPVTFGTVVDDVNIELAPGSSISGRLIAADSKPLGEIYVGAWQEKRDGSWTWVKGGSMDAGGNFGIYGLRAGRYRVRFVPSLNSPYAHQWWERSAIEDEAKSVEIAAGEAAQVGDMRLLRRVINGGSNVFTGVQPVVGQRLMAVYYLDSSLTAVRTYKWYADGVEIRGASENSYVVRAEDLGARISARQSFSGPDLVPMTYDHGETLPVKKGHFEALYSPSVRSEGGTLFSLPVLSAAGAENNWSPEPTSLSYQWQRDGRDLEGESSARHQVTPADFGSELSVRMRIDRPGYESAEAVATAGMTCYPESAVGDPVVSGVRAVGSTISVSGGPAATKMSVSYQWRVGVKALPGQTSARITLTKDLVGKRVVPVVIGRLPGCGTISRALPGEAPMTALAPTPHIKGIARVGATLRVARGTWTRGTSFRYRWMANGEPLTGATKATLKLGKSLKGKTITVAVTGRRAAFETVTRISPSTRRVR